MTLVWTKLYTVTVTLRARREIRENFGGRIEPGLCTNLEPYNKLHSLAVVITARREIGEDLGGGREIGLDTQIYNLIVLFHMGKKRCLCINIVKRKKSCNNEVNFLSILLASVLLAQRLSCFSHAICLLSFLGLPLVFLLFFFSFPFFLFYSYLFTPYRPLGATYVSFFALDIQYRAPCSSLACQLRFILSLDIQYPSLPSFLSCHLRVILSSSHEYTALPILSCLPATFHSSSYQGPFLLCLCLLLNSCHSQAPFPSSSPNSPHSQTLFPPFFILPLL